MFFYADGSVLEEITLLALAEQPGLIVLGIGSPPPAEPLGHGAIMRQPKTEKEIRCPLEYGLSVFGGKWKSRIICVLNEKGSYRNGVPPAHPHLVRSAVISAM